MYITIQFKRAISSWHLFQKLNPNRVVLYTNICKKKSFCYTSRRVIEANWSEDYLTSVKKRSLTKCKNEVLSLVIVKYSEVIFLKFKVIKFTIL